MYLKTYFYLPKQTELNFGNNRLRNKIKHRLNVDTDFYVTVLFTAVTPK